MPLYLSWIEHRFCKAAVIGSSPMGDFHLIKFFMIKNYNYSHIISEKDQKKAINLTDNLIKSGNWCKFVPKYQTWPNLNQYDEFKIFEETFITSCLQYLNFTPNFKVSMWVFRDNRFNNMKKDQFDLWHCHVDGKISGLYYLKNLRNEGTQFKNFNMIPKKYTWHIYPSHLLHKPPVIKSFRNRYTIAANFEY